MYLAQLQIKNFRKYEDCTINFRKGFNLLVGENDSGKSAIIDAIRKVLWTHSYEPDKLEEEDFFNCERDDREIKITCVFKGLEDPEETQHFLEWIGIENDKPFLKVWYIGKYNRDTRRCYGEVRAGPDEEGNRIDSKALEYLKVTYLKPLRDAESELEARKYSRLSRILHTHDAFDFNNIEEERTHTVYLSIKNANEKLIEYFSQTENCDDNCSTCPETRKKKCGKRILKTINENLEQFSTIENLESKIRIGKDLKIKDILETLELKLGAIKPGLGALNRLFIAVEFLLLQKESYTGLRLALIEEIEAHLHPQAQLKLIEFLQDISEKEGIQLIITTHSPNLASKIYLKNIILLKDNRTYSLGKTKLEENDYRFLQRFLDVTKANMFFANGIIIVEGPSEEILIPVLAEKIDRPLTKYGVSIVNVRGKAFLRYSRIYQLDSGGDGETIGVPVAIVTDADADPDDDELEDRIRQKKEKYGYGDKIEAFVSPELTLEYCLAESGIRNLFIRSIIKAGREMGKITDGWESDLESKDSMGIYNEYIKEGKRVSKSIIGQCLADIISREKLPEDIEDDGYIGYLFDAIKHVTSQEN